jgi:hypothetical protein
MPASQGISRYHSNRWGSCHNWVPGAATHIPYPVKHYSKNGTKTSSSATGSNPRPPNIPGPSLLAVSPSNVGPQLSCLSGPFSLLGSSMSTMLSRHRTTPSIIVFLINSPSDTLIAIRTVSPCLCDNLIVSEVISGVL